MFVRSGLAQGGVDPFPLQNLPSRSKWHLSLLDVGLPFAVTRSSLSLGMGEFGSLGFVEAGE